MLNNICSTKNVFKRKSSVFGAAVGVASAVIATAVFNDEANADGQKNIIVNKPEGIYNIIHHITHTHTHTHTHTIYIYIYIYWMLFIVELTTF